MAVKKESKSMHGWRILKEVSVKPFVICNFNINIITGFRIFFLVAFTI
jgi:hypothetical protein